MQINVASGFMTSDIDTAGDPSYFGYLHQSGSWYILQQNTTLGTLRYTSGRGSYETAWSNRASLSYGLWSAL